MRRHRRADALEFGSVLGVLASLGVRLQDESVAASAKHATQLLAAHEASAAAQPGEARLLSLIVHGPVRDMLRQLET